MKQWNTASGTIYRLLTGPGNVYLVVHQGKSLMVDTGAAPLQQMLWKALEKSGLPHPVFVAVTHTHFDHASNAAFIEEQCQATAIVHTAEEEWLRSGISPISPGLNPVSKPLVEWFGPTVARQQAYPGCTAIRAIDQVTSLVEEGFGVTVLPTPGHSPGSISLVVDDAIALVGDTLFSPAKRTMPPFATSLEDLMHSWEALLDTGCDVFLPGHGPALSRAQVENAYARYAPRYCHMEPKYLRRRA